MDQQISFEEFISSYPQVIAEKAILTRELVLSTIAQVDEEIDLSARIVGYSLGKGYKNTLCTIIPSQNSLKLGFYKGFELIDPECMLTGSGKVHKHVVITNLYGQRTYIKYLLNEAFKMWKNR